MHQHNIITNLSDIELSAAEESLLRKGLNYIPTARDLSRNELFNGFDALRTTLRKSNDTTPTETTKTRKSPFFKPSKTTIHAQTYLPPFTEGLLDELREDLAHLPTLNAQPNLSKQEWNALTRLKNDKNIVINNGDKGSSIVLQNRKDYIKNNEDHLSDTFTYTPLDGDPTGHLVKQITTLLNDFKSKGFLTEEMYKFCLPPKLVRLARFYSLLKIHKNPMKIRPIVSSCNSPTENISQFLDHWLQHCMRALPSYLQDTNQLINDLCSLYIPEDSWLITVDVKSLYTCIPHSEGIEACRHALLATESIHIEQPPTEVLITLIELVLQNNTFEFNNKVYKQINGVAMGTKMAVAYANIFMGQLEKNILSNSSLKICFYRRFIDDILIISNDTEANLINQAHPKIKFTAEYNRETITFLDVDIYKGPNFPNTHILDFKTHIKPTNPQLHVHALSYHPRSVKKGIIIGETKRLLRTNSRRETFSQFVNKYKTQMTRRGYSLNFIKTYTNTIEFKNRSALLHKSKTKKASHRTIFSVRYTPMALRATQVIRRYWPRIRKMKTLSNKVKSTPMFAPRTNKNIRSHLVRAKLPPLNSQEANHITTTQLPLQITPPRDYNKPQPQLCGQPHCFLDKLIDPSSLARSSITNRAHPIRESLHCSSTNVIYLITCKNCKIQFIDHSYKTIRLSVAKHLQLINMAKIQQPALPFHAHYLIPNHTMNIQPLETAVPAQAQNKCNTWIQRMQCQYPKGLNL